MNLHEDISRIKQMMGIINEDNSKKDLSTMIRESLNGLIDRNKHIVCDIEVTAPWNRETIEPEKSFKHYKVLIKFIGGYGTKYFPTTQAVQEKYDNIMDEVWETVYGFFGEPTDVYSKKVKECITTEKKEQTEGKDPKTGTGKKPKGSGRRLYTDENPSDTVSVKFRTKEDIVDTLNKDSFKSKPHNRQSQIINLIHQRVRAAYQNAKDPETKQRLKRAYDYIEGKKEQSKQKTIRLQKEGLDDKWTRGEDTVTLKQLLKITKDIPVTKMSTKKLMKHALHGDNPEEMKKVDKTSLKYPVLVLVNDNGLIKYILDGHHRIQKANKHDIRMVNVKLIKFSELPKNFKKVLGGEKEEQNEGELTERCWKGYTQKGMKTMFGKRYPNCVKKTK